MTVTVTLFCDSKARSGPTRAFTVYNIHAIKERADYIELDGYPHTETPTVVIKAQMAAPLHVS